jgi:hypothetical protein
MTRKRKTAADLTTANTRSASVPTADDQADDRRSTGAFIPVGITTTTPSGGPYCAPGDVRTPAQLPQRLYLGSIVPDTFETHARGWSARYRDADPDTWVRLDYSSGPNLLSAGFTWRGIEGMAVFANGSDWQVFTRQMVRPLPRAWESELARACAARFNLSYQPAAPSAPSLVGFPDGVMMTLLLPVPPSRLPELTGRLDAIEADPAIKTAVGIGVIEVRTRVHLAASTGPGGKPGHDESVHLVQIVCVFREVLRVAEHFRQAGFIGEAATPDHAAYPNGPRWRAVVTPLGTALIAAAITAGDALRTLDERQTELDIRPLNPGRRVDRAAHRIVEQPGGRLELGAQGLGDTAADLFDNERGQDDSAFPPQPGWTSVASAEGIPTQGLLTLHSLNPLALRTNLASKVKSWLICWQRERCRASAKSNPCSCHCMACTTRAGASMCTLGRPNSRLKASQIAAGVKP